ncbi:MAG: NAD-dependent epimerase/dehydratase family protein [Flavobacteriales bacterium]
MSKVRKRIFITGGAGFIGFHLQSALSQHHEVRAMDLLDPLNTMSNRRAELLGEISKSDIRQSFLTASTTPDIFIHLAALTGISRSAIDPSAYLEVNVNGTLNALKQAQQSGVKYFIYASSSSVYTPSEGAVTEDSDTSRPLSFYGATKKMSEILVENYCRQHGMIAIGLRFFTVYGSWTRTDMAAFKFLTSIDQGSEVTIYQPNQLQRDFTHVSDIVQGIEHLIEILPNFPEGTHEIFNIGCGHPVFVQDFAQLIAKNLGKELRMKAGILPVNEVLSTHADTRKLTLYTGFKPQVSVEEGVAELVRWYQKFK